ncbi:cytochrome P450 78A5-like [Salvia hispanica]|uniref:cytochrome P450 78A5-like n=1 Tax=Salvia hispanica TaxID=49212 RepID=UPI0020090694|nr:cytochrome P450 78A5-like [Salvia hispanica]
MKMSSEFLFFFIFPHSSPLHLLWLLLLTAVFGLWLTPGGLAWAKSRTRPAIPGPSGLPLLGLAPAFASPLTHQVLASLSKTLDATSLMAFSVGSTRLVVASSPGTAREILTSPAFSDRPVKESARELLFHRAMGFAPCGDYWRGLRRVSALHLFSPRRLAAFESMRREIGLEMMEKIARENGGVEVRSVLHFGALKNVMMSVFGKWDDGGDVMELEGLVREGYEVLGVFNWSDHFPVLGWMDLQGVRRRSRDLGERVGVFVGKIVEEHRVIKREDHNQCFLDVLLGMEENRLDDSDMIALLWEMVFRGTDTVAILLEWILARMILHPDIQTKAQHEIDTAIGANATIITDSDLVNLPYLQAIVKETLRMHPPGPLLSWARLAIHDTHVGQHFVPAGTTAMVNMWAIANDEKVWAEPTKFRPERFIEEDVAIMGSDLRLAPFGSGRRVCPGKAMGLATVHLWLAQLLRTFKWSASSVDLSECLKMSMEMKHPLVCKAIPRGFFN